jgi:signal transduction histidine kinase
MSDADTLRLELEQARAALASMSEELDETNRGVVALYAELDDRAAELRQTSELKSRFLAYLSHEFRTPLSAIRSISGILLDRLDGPLEPEQDRQVRFILGAAVELTQMVDDLLDLAKVEAGRITVSPLWFDLVDLFGALRGMFKPIVGTQVSLIFEEPVDVGKLYTDDQKLSQILRNYISNALKFTVDGEVRVSATRISGERVRFAVADTGPGIAEMHMPLLFQDYSQLPTEQRRSLRGTGLGLSVCRRFAELLGGSVGVESVYGSGSTFFVDLPIALDALPTAEPETVP